MADSQVGELAVDGRRHEPINEVGDSRIVDYTNRWCNSRRKAWTNDDGSGGATLRARRAASLLTSGS